MEPKKALTLLFFGQIFALIYAKLILQMTLKVRIQFLGSDRFGDGFWGALFRDYWMLVGLLFSVVFYFSLKAVVQRASDWRESVGIYAISLMLTLSAVSVAWISTGKLLLGTCTMELSSNDS